MQEVFSVSIVLKCLAVVLGWVAKESFPGNGLQICILVVFTSVIVSEIARYWFQRPVLLKGTLCLRWKSRCDNISPTTQGLFRFFFPLCHLPWYLSVFPSWIMLRISLSSIY